MRYAVTGVIWTVLCLTGRPGVVLPAEADGTVPVQTARRIVFHDANRNGQFDQGETVLPGIRVSNGRDVVSTDSSGRYELPVSEDTILFVLKPRGWRTPICPMQLPRDLSLFEPQARVIALLGLPWYNVIGNHDLNFDATTDRHSDETFERVFGPSYYSFDYGPVHFLIVDNVEWSVDSIGSSFPNRLCHRISGPPRCPTGSSPARI